MLVNSNCIPGCPKRVKHYYQIGLQQIAYTNHVKKYPNAPFDLETFNKKNTAMETSDCPYMSRIITEIKETSAHIKPDDIYNKYAPMGFEQFKIEGRTASIPNLMETYLYYMVKPECIDTARFMFLHLLAMNDVIVYNE